MAARNLGRSGRSWQVPQSSRTSASVPSLDGLPAASGAFSVYRKLRSAYAGAALRVRRTSDSVQQDIGFSGDYVDTTALLSFCGVSSGQVATLYDQSGNGRNLTQGTNSCQPRIVNAGALDTNGAGRPVMVFDGVDDYLSRTDALGFSGSPAMTVAHVYKAPLGGNQFLWGFGASGAVENTRWQGFAADTGDAPFGYGISQGGASGLRGLISWSGAAATQADGIAVVHTKPASSTTNATVAYINGSSTAATSQGTLNNTAVNMSNGVCAIGCASTIAAFGAQSMNLFVLYSAVLTGTDLATLNAVANSHRA